MKQESYRRIATYLWCTVAQNSTTGNWTIDKSEIEGFFRIKLTNEVCEQILTVMYQEFDVLDCEFECEDNEYYFDITIGTNFVVNYDEGNEGDYVDYEHKETYFEAEEYQAPVYEKVNKKLNLTAICDEEKDILEYLENNASEALREKINKKPERPILPCLVYCYDEAQKLYKERKGTHNCAMVRNETVYGWAVHYYEDVEEQQDIEKAKKVLEKLKAQEKAKSEPKPTKVVKPIETPKKPIKPSAEKLIKAYKQLSLLDMLEEE